MYSSAAGEAVPGVSLYSTCIAVRRVKLCRGWRALALLLPASYISHQIFSVTEGSHAKHATPCSLPVTSTRQMTRTH